MCVEHRGKDGKIAGEIGRDAISILRNLWAKFCSHVASLITREPVAGRLKGITIARTASENRKTWKGVVSTFQCKFEQIVYR